VRALTVALAVALLGAAAVQAAKGPRVIDQVWTHPEIARFNVRSVAMLPPANFEHNLEAEKVVQVEWGRQFAGTGYRWVSAMTARDLLRASAGGDSILKAVNHAVLADGRIDSLSAPALCARLRTDALLTVRVDQWVQVAIPPEQSGKPSTTIQLRAALVDSTGQLLWRIGGSETTEGVYVEPIESVTEASGSAVTRSTGLHGSTAPGAPPAYVDVLDLLLARWARLFPAHSAPADSAK
jgi:hypothetical protein